jgi:hypothetical protein
MAPYSCSTHEERCRYQGDADNEDDDYARQQPRMVVAARIAGTAQGLFVCLREDDAPAIHGSVTNGREVTMHEEVDWHRRQEQATEDQENDQPPCEAAALSVLHRWRWRQG